MHEQFAMALTENWQDFSVNTADFAFPKTLSCLEEITFVLRPEDFADEELLQGSLELRDLVIE